MAVSVQGKGISNEVRWEKNRETQLLSSSLTVAFRLSFVSWDEHMAHLRPLLSIPAIIESVFDKLFCVTRVIDEIMDGEIERNQGKRRRRLR
jgi:hypothetical protein